MWAAIIALCIVIASNPARTQSSNENPNDISQNLDGKESNDTILSRYNINGQIKFENNNDSGQFGLVTFDGPSVAQTQAPRGPSKVTFPDSGDGGKPQKKRRRRRRRKMKYRRQEGAPGGYYGQAGYQQQQLQQQQRPTKLRPLEGQLGVLQEVLNSLYSNDDRACLPLMLCTEAYKYKHDDAGDKSYSELIDALNAIVTNAPQITKLTGFDTSGLLHIAQEFLKPVNIGTAVSNIAVCNAEYPNCPNNTLDFAEYLINNKGGFEHFFKGKNYKYTVENINKKLNLDAKNTNFNAILHPPPNAEAMTNWNAPPNEPTYQANQGAQNPYQQNAFIQNPYPQAPYQPIQYQQNQYQQNQYQPNQYKYQAYRRRFPYKNNLHTYKENVIPKLQERIQNKPVIYIGKDYRDDNEISSKWSFPKNEQYADNSHRGGRYLFTKDEQYVDQRPRQGRHLKFPDQDSESREQKPHKGFLFPEVASNFLYGSLKDFDDASGVEEELGGLAEGGDLVYVVRDGDPNRPIVYRLRKGETIPDLGSQ